MDRSLWVVQEPTDASRRGEDGAVQSGDQRRWLVGLPILKIDSNTGLERLCGSTSTGGHLHMVSHRFPWIYTQAGGTVNGLQQAL